MPKMKTKKSMKAKFKVTATGKLLRSKQGRRHKLAKRSSNKKRFLKNPAVVTSAHANKYKRLIGA